jgi:hypothetical protein
VDLGKNLYLWVLENDFFLGLFERHGDLGDLNSR